MAGREIKPSITIFSRPRMQDGALAAVALIFGLTALRFDLGEDDA